MTITKQRPHVLGAVLLLALLVSGCGTGATTGAHRINPDRKATPYVASHTKALLGDLTTIGVARSVVELLPNHLFEVLDHNFVANAQSVVVGTPVDVQPDEALRWPAQDANDQAAGEAVPFGETSAMSRTWLVTLSVDRTVAGPAPAELLRTADSNGLVSVRITSDGGPIDVDKYRAGLLGMGRSVWFLSAYADAPTDAFGVAWFGGAIARLDDRGLLRFDLLPPEVRKFVESPGIDLNDLERAADQAEVTIPRDAG